MWKGLHYRKIISKVCYLIRCWLVNHRMNKENVVVLKISAPIKLHFTNTKGLDYQTLLGSENYKEQYRKEMILWGEQERKKDYGIFCRTAIEMFNAMEKPIWIVSDIRRKTDIRWFKENFGTVVSTVKIVSDEQVRKSRGWIFEEGVDDKESECDLDDVTEWDVVIANNGLDDLDLIICRMKDNMETCLKSKT
ncbi:phosphomevalonate kinase isoform X2 [Rhodnius prolixus]|uniref:phosphomevalonate kinase isoform X2 n=1 Tax=Rhodnius prolixus TaxID=13249 RepID=UPI003D18CEFE